MKFKFSTIVIFTRIFAYMCKSSISMREFICEFQVNKTIKGHIHAMKKKPAYANNKTKYQPKHPHSFTWVRLGHMKNALVCTLNI